MEAVTSHRGRHTLSMRSRLTQLGNCCRKASTISLRWDPVLASSSSCSSTELVYKWVKHIQRWHKNKNTWLPVIWERENLEHFAYPWKTKHVLRFYPRTFGYLWNHKPRSLQSFSIKRKKTHLCIRHRILSALYAVPCTPPAAFAGSPWDPTGDRCCQSQHSTTPASHRQAHPQHLEAHSGRDYLLPCCH